MKDNIYRRMTKKSWERNRFATICFTVFVALSVAMISLTAMLFVNLTGAIDRLMELSKTPDYLQMHSGPLDMEEIEDFVSEQEDIEAYQVMGFLNFDNSILFLGEQSMLDSTQDNGVCLQGAGFDYMVTLDNEIPKVLPGQVYVPVCYEPVYSVKAGDILRIGEMKLVVAGFIRDAQMNSMMASSKRFLVCEEDYDKLREMGQEEYLIEFLLRDGTDKNAFQKAYEQAKLPMNGPTITGPLIKMMNTLSDGIMILIILFISLLVLLIALVCIRFMLITCMVSEVSDVGVLKAVGISYKEIRAMFLRRYSWLILAGTVVGMILSVVVFRPLSAQMQRLYGVSGNAWEKYTFAFVSAFLVGGAIVLFVVRILHRLKEMTAVKVLTGKYEERKRGNNKCVITLVMALSLFLMMIPANLYSTLSAPEFVTYMGIGNAQIRMDLREGVPSKEAFSRIAKKLQEDTAVKEYVLYQTGSIPVRLSDGTEMNMLMEQGDHTCFPVAYHKGCAPSVEGDVALSYLLAEELGLEPGDDLWVKEESGYEKCRVSGIYSDITNGGKTAKQYIRELQPKENIMWRIAYVTLQDGADQMEFMDRYADEGAEVVDITARIKGTYGPTLSQIQNASVLVDLVASIIILFVIMLFVRMMIANLRNQISIQKALGYKCIDIKKEFWKNCTPYLIVGTVVGTILGCSLGEWLCGMALQSLGAVGFAFVLKAGPIVFNMILGTAVSVLAEYLGSYGINEIHAVECCRGRE